MPNVRTCARCGKDLHGRRDMKFCSGACRQSNYRSRNTSDYGAECYGSGGWDEILTDRPYTTDDGVSVHPGLCGCLLCKR